MLSGQVLEIGDFLRSCYSENGHFALEMGLGKSFLWAKKMHNPTGHNSHSLPKIISLSPVGTRLSVGEEVILEITQIGKECHTRCAIFRQVGQCVMPEEGVFARVIRGGVVEAGDSIRAI